MLFHPGQWRSGEPDEKTQKLENKITNRNLTIALLVFIIMLMTSLLWG